MRQHKRYYILAGGMLGGIYLSYTFINPYFGNITLSEAILQLSGSRGEFPLDTGMLGLLLLTMRILPGYVFMMFSGVLLYRHFCTASIYVFSRQVNRIKWFDKEVFLLGMYCILFEAIVCGAAILTALLRYQILWDKAGVALLGIHILLYSLWLFSGTLFINIAALKVGSSTAFFIFAAVQTICIAALGILNTIPELPENQSAIRFFLLINPISRMVLGWHTGKQAYLKEALHAKYDVLFFPQSILLWIALALLIVFVGKYVISRHDLLTADPEIDH